MKAKVCILDEETDKEEFIDFSFDENYLSAWYVNLDGELNVVIDGVMFTLEPNDDLMTYLQHNFDY